MNLADIERLVSELLARGDMNADTIGDLTRIQDEARAGTAHPDDVDYLSALHARIFESGDAVEIEPVVDNSDEVAALRAENSALRAELEEARSKIAELEERLSAQG
jgi:polyhydroxyalkanoate synthesis regulator phasin